MTIYIDANFILQSALHQEELPAISELLSLIESKSLTLKCATVAFVEALNRVSNRNPWRANFRELLQHQVIDDLSRSSLHMEAYRKVRDIGDYLIAMRDDEEKRLDLELDRLMRLGIQLLPLTQDNIRTASQLRSQYRMRLPDSYIAAAVLFDLHTQGKEGPAQPSIFITGDEAFKPLISELRASNCKFCSRYKNALDYVKHSLSAP